MDTERPAHPALLAWQTPDVALISGIVLLCAFHPGFWFGSFGRVKVVRQLLHCVDTWVRGPPLGNLAHR